MKHLLFALFLCLAPFCAKSQADSLTHGKSSNEILYEFFSQLDTARMPKPFLYELAIPFIDFANFNGKTDSILERDEWLYLYHQLTYACLRPGIMEPVDSILDMAMQINKEDSSVIPLAIMFYEVSRLKDSTVFSDSLISFTDSFFTDGPVMAGNPYKADTIFAIAPMFDFSIGSVVKYRLHNNFHFTYGHTLTGLEIDFDDGIGYRPCSLGQDITINYTTVATREIKVKAWYDGQPDYLKASSKKDEIAPAVAPTDVYYAHGSRFNSLPCNIPALYPSDGTKFNYKEATTNTRMPGQTLFYVKPVIIVEGIDFIDWTNPTSFHQYGDIGWDVLYNGQGSTAYPQLAEGKMFIDKLIAEGHDVFVVDFEKPNQEIEKNAEILIRLIKHVQDYLNMNNGVRDDITIIGASMGGLVSRYALARLEQAGCNHCVRLYCSFDSPHQGANAPYSAQSMISWLNYNDKLNALNKPATRQMLYTNVSAKNSNNSQVAIHQDHINWQQSLSQIGYPQYTRKVAISCGSKSGAQQTYGGSTINNGDKFFGITIPAIPLWIRSTGWAMKGDNQGLLRQNTVFLGEIGIILPFIGFSAKKVVAPQAQPINMYNFYDNCAGSKLDHLAGIPRIIRRHGIYHTFVPVVSALDLYPSFHNENYNINVDNLLLISKPEPSKYPFDAYLALDNNDRHVAINHATRTWMFDEITNSTQNYGSTLNSFYNYGRYERRVLYPVTIGAGGHMHVNKVGPTDGIAPPGPNSQQEKFIIYTAGCGGNVIIENGGKLELGDGNPSQMNNHLHTSTVIIRKGHKLILNENGTLIVNNHSRLVIDEGAELEFNHNTAAIILNGDDAILEIRGKLKIANNVTFKYTGSGFLSIKQVLGQYLEHNVYTPIPGANGKFEITGSGTSDKILEVIGGESMQSTDNVEVTIKNGYIELQQGCRLSIKGKCKIENVNVIRPGGTSYLHRGIHTYGQIGVILKDLNISYGLYGFMMYSYGGPGVGPTISSCNITHCTDGIYAHNVPLKVYSTTIKNNSLYGINGNAFGNVDNHILSSSIIESNGGGAKIPNGVSTTQFMFYNSTAYSNTGSGIEAYGGLIKSSCSVFDNNFEGILSANNNTVVLAPWPIEGLGNNIFFNNESSVFLDKTEVILADGKNSFTLASQNHYSIEGKIGSPIDVTIDGNNNFWDHNSDGIGTMPVANTDYEIENLSNNPVLITYTTFLSAWSENDCIIGPPGGNGGGGGGGGTPLNQTHLKISIDAGKNYYKNDSIKVAFTNYFADLIINSTSNNFIMEKINIDEAYSLCAEGVSHVFQNYKLKLVDSIQLAQVISKFHSVNQHCITNSTTLPDAKRNRFKYTLAEVALYKDEGKYNESLHITDSMKLWADSSDLEYINVWQCWVQQDKAIAEKRMSIDSAIEFFKCTYNRQRPAGVQNAQFMSGINNSQKAGNNKLVIMPNPARTEISFANIFQNNQIQCTILDMQGKIVLNEKINTPANTGYTKLNVQNLRPGIYLLQVLDGKDAYQNKFTIID